MCDRETGGGERERHQTHTCVEKILTAVTHNFQSHDPKFDRFAFDIVMETPPGMHRRPDAHQLPPIDRKPQLPTRLATLERKSKRRRKMTLQDIERKLQRAEQRRKVWSGRPGALGLLVSGKVCVL